MVAVALVLMQTYVVVTVVAIAVIHVVVGAVDVVLRDERYRSDRI